MASFCMDFAVEGTKISFLIQIKAIYQSVGGEYESFPSLDFLQVAFRKKISNKRFLIVLDEVWNENYEQWELLEHPFLTGAPGSKILVTSRKTKAQVDKSMFSHPQRKNFIDAILNKCDGMPLALIMLGRHFRTKTNVEEWEEVLNGDSCNVLTQDKILSALKLSYYNLPSHLKQMFVYCSIFLRAYIFVMDEVMLLWMAEGFLYHRHPTMSLENFGCECFRLLENFFSTLGNEIDLETMKETLNKVHHLSFSSGEFKKFDVLHSIKHLRTLLGLSLIEPDSSRKFLLPPKVLIELIPHLQFLRVLNLSNYSITEVPKSIGTLVHMRYLNFSNTDITCLPEEVGDLCYLQSLLLRGCEKLHTLPNSVIKLINLRHLDIRDTPCLLPLGIGELKNLQSLSNVIIGGKNGLKISELKNLSTLQGRVSLEGLHKVTNVEEANEASLRQKKDIDDLEMEWSDVFDSRDEKTEYQLPSLGHLQALKKLFVESMKNVATVGPELLGSPTFCVFPKLEVLEFKDMEGWEKWSIDSDGTRSSKSYPCLYEISLSNCVKLKVESKHLIPLLEVIHIQECST
ncbi:putative disease resistance RPP13-like protein 1 [Rutidosis leptorrhynchoides]|uniref:putative disease resistance RPP13-like protein 1 n=1 Tax=Rutidosis leptorrhynchoides TaxID=125765 RepID=UPI003A9A54D3